MSAGDSSTTQPPPADPPAPLPPLEPTVHEAGLASGPSGAVIRGMAIDFDAAVERRRAGKDVVICGDDVKVNGRLAARIEAAVGPCVRSGPHRLSAGPLALPHFQQQDPDKKGHTFYETPNRRARRKQ